MSGHSSVYRAWINQPSDWQPLHARHGENVLAARYTDTLSVVWPLSGPVVSMVIPTLSLSKGWMQ